MVMFNNLHTEAGLRSLEEYLSAKTYISGDQLGLEDIKVYEAISEKPDAAIFANCSRWYHTVSSDISNSRYSICGDQTIKMIAQARPSTKARLANIDGVNQHLVTAYGDHILQSVNNFSQGLGLSLDQAVSIQTDVRSKVHSAPRAGGSLTKSRLDAWRMWHEDGLTIRKIANFPGRAAPLKETTVFEYILEAAKVGYEMNWKRLCEEMDITQDIYSNIKGAILRVGSRERLKPIKEELPEEISYGLIRAVVTMEDLGLPAEVFPGLESMKLSAAQNETSGPPLASNDTCRFERSDISHVVESPLKEKEEAAPANPVNDSSSEKLASIKQPRTAQDEASPRKCRKIYAIEEENVAPLATEESISELIKTSDGVSLADIVKHFKGSNEELIGELVSSLESDFMIYKKNDKYKFL